MNNTIISALDEQFKKDCKVINLKYEYPGYTGIEQWAIIRTCQKMNFALNMPNKSPHLVRTLY